MGTLVLLICSQEAYGHGFMYFPTPWNSNSEITPTNGIVEAIFGSHYPQPDYVCDRRKGGSCSYSALTHGYETDWFTNFTFIPGNGRSMSEEMYSAQRISVEIDGKTRYNPWAQPGTAPLCGEGCGVNGGNPNGCQGDYYDSSPFGTCCGGIKKNGQYGCGGYTGGKSALEHYADGLFGEMFTTTWTRG